MKKLMNLLGLLLLSLTISLSTTSCGDKDDKKDNKEENDKSTQNSDNNNWPQGLIEGCEKMMLDQMSSDPMPDEVRAMLTDFPTYEEVASCVCETLQSNYPTISDLSELENMDDATLGMQLFDCMGEDFKKLMEMGGMEGM